MDTPTTTTLNSAFLSAHTAMSFGAQIITNQTTIMFKTLPYNIHMYIQYIIYIVYVFLYNYWALSYNTRILWAYLIIHPPYLDYFLYQKHTHLPQLSRNLAFKQECIQNTTSPPTHTALTVKESLHSPINGFYSFDIYNLSSHSHTIQVRLHALFSLG